MMGAGGRTFSPRPSVGHSAMHAFQQQCLHAVLLLAGARFLVLAAGVALAQGAPVPAAAIPAHHADRILIKPKAASARAAVAGLHTATRSDVLASFEGMGRLQVIRVPAGETVSSLIARYQRSGLVEFAEPDYLVSLAATPNEPKFHDGTLWGLHNTGQNGGTPDADIDAPEAWDVLTSASNIVVAVVDTGVRYTHEDLKTNIWTNPSDGSHGFNALNGTMDPADDNGHGTSVAGVLGAAGNNGKGVAGVAWRVQIMGCKCFDSLAIGSVSAVAACLDFARTNGARIINASWGFNTNSLALSNAMAAVRDAGIIVVAACGNGATNIDVAPVYPIRYGFDNLIAVASVGRRGTLSSFSNYGASSVDLAAPGEEIYSTFGATDTFYLSRSGASFAAPYVTGAMALMLAKFPGETYQQIIARLLRAVDPLPALSGKCRTGGRLNLREALSPSIALTILPITPGVPTQLHLATGPRRLCVIEACETLPAWTPIYTNTTSAAGTFDFTDCDSPGLPRRFYRATAAP